MVTQTSELAPAVDPERTPEPACAAFTSRDSPESSALSGRSVSSRAASHRVAMTLAGDRRRCPAATRSASASGCRPASTAARRRSFAAAARVRTRCGSVAVVRCLGCKHGAASSSSCTRRGAQLTTNSGCATHAKAQAAKGTGLYPDGGAPRGAYVAGGAAAGHALPPWPPPPPAAPPRAPFRHPSSSLGPRRGPPPSLASVEHAALAASVVAASRSRLAAARVRTAGTHVLTPSRARRRGHACALPRRCQRGADVRRPVPRHPWSRPAGLRSRRRPSARRRRRAPDWIASAPPY